MGDIYCLVLSSQTIAASSSMPELAEVEQKPVEVDSGTDSENDDMPELEPTGNIHNIREFF